MKTADAGGQADQQAAAERGVSLLAQVGLAGRSGFYLILTAITVRIALLGGGRAGGHADAHGALAIVSRPLIGRVAIGAVAVGFVLFGIGRLAGAWKDDSVSAGRRVMTAVQGVFYLALAYVPASFLAGDKMAGSQQEEQHTTRQVLVLPGGRLALAAAGLIFIGVCLQQIRGALAQDFRDGLDLAGAPGWVRRITGTAGSVGITARALVFLPLGIFLIVAAFQNDAKRAYGTDGELLRLSGYGWGRAALAAVALGLAVFTLFSAIETRYRKVISAK